LLGEGAADGAAAEAKKEAVARPPMRHSISYTTSQVVAAKVVDELVRPGHVIGVGTGSTVNAMLTRLSELLKSGALTNVSAVPTSKQTELECERLNIPCVAPDSNAPVDIALGSADAADRARNVIKGGKGAMLREKLVRECATQYVVVIDQKKLCDKVGSSYPLPVEISPFHSQRTLRRIAALPSLAPCEARLRYGVAPAGLPGCAMPGSDADAKPFVTDNGNLIVDLFMATPIRDTAAAADELISCPGVLEHGLFVPRESTVLMVGQADGTVKRLDSNALELQ